MSELKTEILCQEHWDDRTLTCMMGPVNPGDHIYMEFTLNEYGRLEGMFEVVHRIHVYEDDRGYRQRVQLRPMDQ